MRERPILFSAPMVRALLDGRKTQTRRVVKGLPERSLEFDRQWHANVMRPGSVLSHWSWWDGPPHGQSIYHTADCPYGVPGERLWVREAFSGPWDMRVLPPAQWGAFCPIHYWADGDPTEGDWTRPKPSIHMPRWASRLTLEITDVRVERLQAISDRGQPNDCIAEGVFAGDFIDKGGDWLERGFSSIERCRFHDLWAAINGPESWADNPWVWAVSFRVLEAGQ